MSDSPSRPPRPTRAIPPIPIAHHGDDQDVLKETSDPTLTPLRAHYLKKALIQLQFSNEFDAITTYSSANVSTLSYLGPPFSPPPRDARPVLDLPFLRYIFRKFVLTFPFMATAPKDFYADKFQPFVSSVLARNISTSSVLDEDQVDDPLAPDSDSSERPPTRQKLLAKLERNLALFIGSATKLVEREDVVRLSQADLDRLEALARKRMRRRKDVFEVNIVAVRTVVDKGRVRSRVHEEFIIRTRRSNYHDVFVSRRYGDFKALANELQKAHPEEQIRRPPAKDRTYVNLPPSPSPSSLPSSFQSTTSLSESEASWQQSYTPTPQQPATAPSRLAREKNRLTLRSYLNSLMTSSVVASSPVLRSFLLSGPIVLTEDELEDARKREEADRMREDGRRRFAKEIASRVDSLRDAVKSVKGDIMGKDGLTHIFSTIKVTPDISGLPPNYQAVVEWARTSLASTVFHHFVAADDASETFASLKRIHSLMPYFMLKATLKISNPIAMIRSILDLFLAQPFGGKSLLQRMFTSSLTEEVKSLEEEIDAVKVKIDDPVMCEKVRLFVYAPREIQQLYKADADAEKLHVLAVVLRAPEHPMLSRGQLHRLAKAHRAYLVYRRYRQTLADSDDDDGPQDEDAWLMEDLKVLTHLYFRLRDREQLISLVFEGSTSELLKDIITIFYAPLAQVYRAASIADSLGDLQNFINDLIKTVEQVEELGQEDPQRTVQAFIALMQRHEAAFYNFVHKVHSKGASLFDSLMGWIESFITITREGLGDPINLEFLLPHTGKERAQILAEVDEVAQYHYKLKVMYEAKLRRRFDKSQNEADAEDEAARALVNGVIGEFNFGDLIQGDADDVAAEETDESTDETSDYVSTSNESDSEDGSEDEVESSSDELSPVNGCDPSVAKKQSPVRSNTGGHHPDPSSLQSLRSPNSPTSHVPSPLRKRSQSLKSSRSMNFSLSQMSLTRRNHDLPPLPPLPFAIKSTEPPSSQKPLPQSPSIVSFTERISVSSTQSLRVSHDRPVPRPKKVKKASQALQPPDLVHIPLLLPLFVEMMRPLLRTRVGTDNAATTPAQPR